MWDTSPWQRVPSAQLAVILHILYTGRQAIGEDETGSPTSPPFRGEVGLGHSLLSGMPETGQADFCSTSALRHLESLYLSSGPFFPPRLSSSFYSRFSSGKLCIFTTYILFHSK